MFDTGISNWGYLTLTARNMGNPAVYGNKFVTFFLLYIQP